MTLALHLRPSCPKRMFVHPFPTISLFPPPPTSVPSRIFDINCFNYASRYRHTIRTSFVSQYLPETWPLCFRVLLNLVGMAICVVQWRSWDVQIFLVIWDHPATVEFSHPNRDVTVFSFWDKSCDITLIYNVTETLDETNRSQLTEWGVCNYQEQSRMAEIFNFRPE